MAENDTAVVVKELHDRSDAELGSLLVAKREDLHAAKFKHALGQLAQTHQLRSLKRDVARLATVLREREMKSAAEGKSAQ